MLCFHGVTEEREGSKPLLWMKLLQLSLGFYETRCNVYRLTTLSYFSIPLIERVIDKGHPTAIFGKISVRKTIFGSLDFQLGNPNR